jgi:hypothetical protein
METENNKNPMPQNSAFFSELYFHPDSRRAEKLRLGGLLFFLNPINGKRGLMTFLNTPALLIAQSMAGDDIVLRTTLVDIHPYLERQLQRAELKDTQTASGKDLVDAFAHLLPTNFGVTTPRGWPPDKLTANIIDQAEKDGQGVVLSAATAAA